MSIIYNLIEVIYEKTYSYTNNPSCWNIYLCRAEAGRYRQGTKAVGIEKYTPGHKVITTHVDMMDDFDIGAFDKNVAFIDTPEEALTALFFSRSINEISELPHNKESVLKLGSMWHFRTAEYPENKENYLNAITYIKTKAKKLYNISVTNSGIWEYYKKAVKNKIYETPIKLFKC